MKRNRKLSKIFGICLSAMFVLGAVSLPNLFGTSAAMVVTDCDVNRDGVINGKDMIRIMKYIHTNDYYFPEKADVNGDGTVDTADVEAIRSYYGQTCEILEDPVIEVEPPKLTYDQLVQKILHEAQVVTKFTDDHGFNYGDPYINPAYNWLDLDINKGLDTSFVTGTRCSCDRLVGWVFHRAGFSNQRFYYGGLNDRDYARYKFIKITNVNDVRAGDIVLVNDTTHQFICAGDNLRYDHGSAERIQRVGAYSYVAGTTLPFSEPIINFSYAWRPNPEGLPSGSLANIYKTPSANVALPASDTDTVYTAANGSGSRQFNFEYNPYNANYELHMNISSYPSTTDYSPSSAAYIGVRLPSPSLTPTGAGGIWVAIRFDGYVYFYTGTGCSKDNRGYGNVWSEPLAETRVPESFQAEHKVMVVDTGDVIKYYMVTHNPGNTHLICSIKVSPDYDHICIRDSTGNFLYSGLTSINHTGYFGVWTHLTNSTQSNISIQCSSK